MNKILIALCLLCLGCPPSNNPRLELLHQHRAEDIVDSRVHLDRWIEAHGPASGLETTCWDDVDSIVCTISGYDFPPMDVKCGRLGCWKIGYCK